jgi:hydrogenase nickel incorporation protein HypA/HybF
VTGTIAGAGAALIDNGTTPGPPWLRGVAFRPRTGGNAMHELAITQSVVDAVTERTGRAQVASVRLRVGRLAGVVPDAMLFCFELVTAGTPLEGAALEFEQPEGRGHCRTCGDDFPLADLILLCPCGSADVELLAGRELVVASVVMARPASS